MAVPGTPSAFNASTMLCARDSPRFSAADCASGSLDVASPYPVTPTVLFPRLAAKALTSSVAGCDRLEAPSTNTMVADGPPEGAGIDGAETGAGGGGAPAAAGRGGGPAGNAGCSAAAVASVAAAGGDGTGCAGASNGALCTALRGAGAGAGGGPGGGAVTAGMEALAPKLAPAAEGEAAAGWPADAGGGGGAEPTPNKVGDAVGEDGSVSGAD